MLTKLEDTLLHQAPTTFDHAVTSDLRFYDRYWFQAIERGGATSASAEPTKANESYSSSLTATSAS